ncbi:uncharacterized protein BJX67DRAFT_347861 [Aspergillus lucknowensis]|uniref:Uncharacterized protein n=1 Tax=Aspergillus lucknowensis TaxID=176173 RepID=A0ABR4LXF7_9EURO
MAGKVIHATGNTATGFFLQFKRNYSFIFTNRRYEIIPLAQVDSQLGVLRTRVLRVSQVPKGNNSH